MTDLTAYCDRWILLTWTDARDCPNAWTDRETFIQESTLARVISAGVLVHVDDNRVVLAASKNEDESGIEYGGGITVPRSWILEVKPLREGKVVSTVPHGVEHADLRNA